MKGISLFKPSRHLLISVHYFYALWYNSNIVAVPDIPEFQSYHAYGVVYDWNYVVIPPSVSNIGVAFGGKLKFLTYWDAIIQCVFFFICFANDFIGSNEINPKQKPLIRKIKDHMFCSIAFPLSAFVCLTFWGLYAIDRELIFPVAMDAFFPTWLNHIMHTNIFVFTLIELFTTFRAYPTRKQGLTTLTVFMTVYLFWVFIIYAKSGHWVYPVMQVLNWPLRIAFFLVMLCFIEGIYIGQEKLNQLVWRKESSKSGRKNESQKKAK